MSKKREIVKYQKWLKHSYTFKSIENLDSKQFANSVIGKVV